MKRSDEALSDLRGEMPWSIQLAAWGFGKWLRGLSKGERMKFASKLIGYVLTLGFLDGYRGKILGVVGILGGLGLIANVAAGGGTDGDIEKGLYLIAGGWGALAVVGKADKIIEATNANTLVTAGVSPEVKGVTPTDAAIVIRNLPGPTPPVTPALEKR